MEKQMIRTKTKIFIQRLNIEMNNLRECVSLLESWSDDDNQDEVMLDAELDVVNRIGETIKEMNNLQSYEWSAVYEAQKALQEAASEPEGDGNAE